MLYVTGLCFCVSYRVAEDMVSAKHPVLRDEDVVTMLLTS